MLPIQQEKKKFSILRVLIALILVLVGGPIFLIIAYVGIMFIVVSADQVTSTQYVVDITKEAGIEKKVIKCPNMLADLFSTDRTREEVCKGKISNDEYQQLVSYYQLQPVIQMDDHREDLNKDTALARAMVERKYEACEIEDRSGWDAYFVGNDERFDGRQNTNIRIDTIFYNPTTHRACLTLQWKYG